MRAWGSPHPARQPFRTCRPTAIPRCQVSGSGPFSNPEPTQTSSSWLILAGPPTLTAYLVDRRAGKVIDRIGITSETVVASISDGVVYLFDDKIGYMIDASTGEAVHRLIETDNYRGLYMSGADRYLQTDAEISTLFGRSLFSYQHLDFAGIVFGCYFPPPQ
jgi:hypothetical protein